MSLQGQCGTELAAHKFDRDVFCFSLNGYAGSDRHALDNDYAIGPAQSSRLPSHLQQLQETSQVLLQYGCRVRYL